MSLANRADIRARAYFYLNSAPNSIWTDDEVNTGIEITYDAMIEAIMAMGGAALLDMARANLTLPADTEILTWTTFGLTQPRRVFKIEDVTDSDQGVRVPFEPLAASTGWTHGQDYVAPYRLSFFNTSIRVLPKVSSARTLRVWYLPELTDLTDATTVVIPVEYRDLLALDAAKLLTGQTRMDWSAGLEQTWQAKWKALEMAAINSLNADSDYIMED
ncbi:MAG: hypothetical protein V1929_12705 [bacterium]